MGVILEPRAKELLAPGRFSVPAGRVCASGPEAAEAASALGGRAVVKAVVPTGRRGKAGGVLLTDSATGAGEAAARLLGTEIHGFPVDAVLVEERLDIEFEAYLAVYPDGRSRTWEVAFSASGGVEIEQAGGQEHVARAPVRPDGRLAEFEARALVKAGGLEGEVIRVFGDAVADLVGAATRCDAVLLEVNPLGLLHDGRVAVVGAMLSVDERAGFRHPEYAGDVVEAVDVLGRPLTDLERAVRAVNARSVRGEHRVVEFLDGDLGVVVGGGGSGLVTLDAVSRLGGRPANGFDQTSGPDSDEHYYHTVRNLLAVDRLRGLFIGSGITAMTPVSLKAKGIVRALRECERDLATFPVVIRMAGPADGEAAAMLAEFPEVRFFRDEVTLEDAVEDFMAMVGGSGP